MSPIRFTDYFPDTYHCHLRQFYDSLPEGILRHEDFSRQGIPCIQFPYLAGMVDPHILDFISEAELPHFAVALQFEILFDMACYTYFKDVYADFQAVTKYPKFIGGCPGACHIRNYPRQVFDALRLLCQTRACAFDYRGVLRESIDPMRVHITTLIATHELRVDPDAFWAKCRWHL
jgi:hypothetical protein